MIRDLFTEKGIVRDLRGNTPILLNWPGMCMLVLSGEVDLSTTEVVDGKASGARHYYVTLREGDLIPNVADCGEMHGRAFLTTGVEGTRVASVPVEDVLKWTQEHGEAAYHALLEGWIRNITQGLVRADSMVPDVPLQAGVRTSFKAGQTLCAKEGLVWVRWVPQAMKFLSGEYAESGKEALPLPLTSSSWVEVDREGSIQPMPTAELQEKYDLAECIHAFHKVLFRIERERVLNEREYSTSRFVSRREKDEAAYEAALDGLAEILEERPRARFHDAGTRDALYHACCMVGEAMALDVQLPPPAEFDSSQDPLGDIVRVSGFRKREVRLSGRWWKSGSTHMLAFLKEGGKPVALIHTRPGHFQLRNPDGSAPQEVTAKMAAEIEDRAFAFYRPFKDKAVSGWELVKFSFRDTKQEVLSIALLGGAGAVLGLVMPFLTGQLFDAVIPGSDRYMLAQISVALVATALGMAAFRLTQGLAILRLAGKTEDSAQPALWDRLLKLPAGFYRKYSSGDLATRVGGIDTIQDMLSGAVITTVLGSIFSSVNLFLMFYYDAMLGLTGLGLIILLVVVFHASNYFQRKHLHVMHALQGKIAGMMLQFTTGIAKLRVSGAEKRAFARWSALFTQQKSTYFHIKKIGLVMKVFIKVFPIACSMTFFAMLGLSSSVSMSTGEFLAFNAAFGQFLAAVLSMTLTVLTLLGIAPVYHRLRPILEAEPEVSAGKTQPSALRGNIEVSHAFFSYDPEGALILNDVCMEARQGEFVAIVGPSGSGKSTLFRLLLGFDHPQSGSVYYDGQDLSGLDIQSVRRQIGVVLQNGKLMAGDIYQNIVGSRPLTVDDAWEAARMAGMEEDLKEMPMGMHTVVSEGGGTLSGGQRQRLMIARAIVGRPRILLFDEATSALDNQTQAIVSRSVENLQATRVVIAHRLSTIINADRIYVLKDGVVVEVGNHESLMKENGVYYDLASRQLV